jgi:polar amino acid transport system substrate-binding protein
MKSFVTIAAAVAVAVIGLGATTAKADDVVKFGVAAEPYPPFTVKDASGKWTGWEVDMRDAVCKQMNVKCEWVETAWDGIIPALQAKKFDVIWSSMSITDERKKTIDFTSKYYNTPASVIGAKDQNFTPDAAGLKGKIIGVQVSTIHLDYVNKYFKDGAKEVKTYQTQDEANQDLAAGRIDAIMADSITLLAFLDTDAGKACCKMIGNVADDPAILGMGVGGGVRKDDTALRDKISAAIKAVRDSGEYAAITKKYFSIDIYGK